MRKKERPPGRPTQGAAQPSANKKIQNRDGVKERRRRKMVHVNRERRKRLKDEFSVERLRSNKGRC